ncbi:MAG TPA: MOSC domain-containing protein [Panacibacter sp.]|nr:MOSC domain-containing protein [Panacibacter sp.]HNP44175.1 MOSC domain-containing protein [Panacibacter sp.]
MLTVSELFIYPIKSAGGKAVDSARLTATGFEHDRRWMLIDDNNRFISQRENPWLALLEAGVTNHGIEVKHKHSAASFTVVFNELKQQQIEVAIWDDVCPAQLVSDKANAWFSEILDMRCRLVYMPETTKRKVDPHYAFNSETTSFSDGFPLLMLGQSSLDDLNKRLTESLPVNRFRPNIMFTGGEPFEEDQLEHFVINGIDCFAVKPCARCTITTTNQQTSERSKEPLATLATYRKNNNNIYFGQNLLYKGYGTINVGDNIEVIRKRAASFLDEIV